MKARSISLLPLFKCQPIIGDTQKAMDFTVIGKSLSWTYISTCKRGHFLTKVFQNATEGFLITLK